jgi:hypothetical protein
MIIVDCFGVKLTVEEHSGNISIVVPTSPEPTRLMIPVNRADELVADIGRIRQTMEPMVPPAVPPGAKIDVVANANFRIWADEFEGFPMLSVRDPRFGWLHYRLGRDGALQVAKAIQQEAEKAPETPKRPS